MGWNPRQRPSDHACSAWQAGSRSDLAIASDVSTWDRGDGRPDRGPMLVHRSRPAFTKDGLNDGEQPIAVFLGLGRTDPVGLLELLDRLRREQCDLS